MSGLIGKLGKYPYRYVENENGAMRYRFSFKGLDERSEAYGEMINLIMEKIESGDWVGLHRGPKFSSFIVNGCGVDLYLFQHSGDFGIVLSIHNEDSAVREATAELFAELFSRNKKIE